MCDYPEEKRGKEYIHYYKMKGILKESVVMVQRQNKINKCGLLKKKRNESPPKSNGLKKVWRRGKKDKSLKPHLFFTPPGYDHD